MAIGGPIFTALTGKTERKKLLIFTMTVFAFGNLIAFFAQDLLLLEMSRIITGITHGVFFANAVIIASSTVGTDKKAAAISLVFAGLLLSTTTGVPIGTFLGITYGWRMTFLAVAVWAILGCIVLSILLPTQHSPTERLSLVDLPKVVRNSGVLIVLTANVFAYTGTFIVFTFLSPLLQKIVGFSVSEINIILLIYGVGATAGNTIGGRFSNAKTSKTLVKLFFFQSLSLIVFSLVLRFKFLVIINVFFFGLFAFANVPLLQLLVVKLSERKVPGSAGIASSLNVSAFNLGTAAGAYIGGLIVDSPLSITATPWLGGLFVLIGLGFAVYNMRTTQAALAE